MAHSEYRGVTWSKAKERWLARIDHEGKQRQLGYFRDEKEAARAYDAAAWVLKGADAQLNFENDYYRG